MPAGRAIEALPLDARAAAYLEVAASGSSAPRGWSRARERRTRLDLALVARGLARSRTRGPGRDARTAPCGSTAPSSPGRSARSATTTVLEVAGGQRASVAARASCDAALDAFAVDVAGRLALDLGASTGGFTQVLLERGARAVVALDVGHDQLAPELRDDPRVIVVEGENARFLTAGAARGAHGHRPHAPAVVVADLSFISLTHGAAGDRRPWRARTAT